MHYVESSPADQVQPKHSSITLIEETSKTFGEYSGKRIREDVLDGHEIVWASERDGWSHLYRYDGATGQVKNQITKGAWAVRGVQHVDGKARQIWFSASGMNPAQDPYFVHFYRINFDGTGLIPLTTADGTHAVTWSSDRQFFVKHLRGVDPPNWNMPVAASSADLPFDDVTPVWVTSEHWH